MFYSHTNRKSGWKKETKIQFWHPNEWAEKEEIGEHLRKMQIDLIFQIELNFDYKFNIDFQKKRPAFSVEAKAKN